jgi:hypothetical protein
MSDREGAKTAWSKVLVAAALDLAVTIDPGLVPRALTQYATVWLEVGFRLGYEACEAESAARIDAIRYAVREVRTAMNAHYGGHVISERMARLEALIEDALDGRGAGGDDGEGASG